MLRLPNWMKATMAMPPQTRTGPRYGITLQTPAARPQHGRVLQADPRQRGPRREGDYHARDQSNEQVAFDLPVDFVQHFERDFSPRQRLAGNLQQLSFEQVSRQQHEKDQEEDHGRVTGEREQAGRSPPEETGEREARLRWSGLGGATCRGSTDPATRARAPFWRGRSSPTCRRAGGWCESARARFARRAAAHRRAPSPDS